MNSAVARVLVRATATAKYITKGVKTVFKKPDVLIEAELKEFRLWLDEEYLSYEYVGQGYNHPEDQEKLLSKLLQDKQAIVDYLNFQNKMEENILAVDIETTGLNSHSSDIRLISWQIKVGLM